MGDIIDCKELSRALETYIWLLCSNHAKLHIIRYVRYSSTLHGGA